LKVERQTRSGGDPAVVLVGREAEIEADHGQAIEAVDPGRKVARRNREARAEDRRDR